jgi:hypothetical protein
MACGFHGNSANTASHLAWKISAGGAFIASHEAMAVGSPLDLHFLLPEGQIRVQAIVRNVREGRGIGVEFVSMGEREFDLILKAIQRLLG